MADFITKVTDPKKIVTDGQVLKELAKQGIDKDYVEFHEDYSAAHPYAKIYKDKKSDKMVQVVSGLPKARKTDGVKIVAKWYKYAGTYRNKPNLFDAVVKDTQITVTALNDQPSGAKAGDSVSWNPQLFVADKEVRPKKVSATILDIDPINENYQNNTLEWDYGVCKRRIRIIEGRIREKWVFDKKPAGTIRIKHNPTGNLKLRLGAGRDADGEPLPIEVVKDEEILSDIDLSYPIEIGASPETFYPDANVESTSVDGYVSANAEDPYHGDDWSILINAEGSYANDYSATGGGVYWNNHATFGEEGFYELRRSIFLFDTSSIPTDATITEATLSLRGYSKAEGETDINIYSSVPASNTALVGGDFNSLGSTPFSATKTYGTWSTSSFNDFVLDANGRNAISKTGVSKFGCRSATHDVGGTTPTWTQSEATDWYLLHCLVEQGSGYEPKLVVTYTVPAPDAPTNVAATDGTYTDKTTVTWTKSAGATGYKVYEGANLLDTLGDVATYDDVAAGAPTITAGTATASDGTSADHVTLSLAGESANNGSSRTYKVIATNASGDSADSATDTGYRGVGALTYQWQRSAGDSDASYSNIVGGTTDPYNDTGAPSDGSGRYYKCVENATGAEQQTSTVDRGYRLYSVQVGVEATGEGEVDIGASIQVGMEATGEGEVAISTLLADFHSIEATGDGEVSVSTALSFKHAIEATGEGEIEIGVSLTHPVEATGESEIDITLNNKVTAGPASSSSEIITSGSLDINSENSSLITRF